MATEIAPNIVTITNGALIGAVALGTALALGLRGREVAARMLESAYPNGQAVTDDVKQGVERGEAEADDLTARLDEPRTTEPWSWGGVL